jgi:tRNA U34 2-thiouridine synthase MnmA/TrmU
VLREQGIRMEGIVFASPFFCIDAAHQAAKALKLTLHVADFTCDILRLVEKPPRGFGSGMNPCIDCHACMIRRAAEMVRERGFDFVSTGEVVGQRPMSQHRHALDLVAKDSGAKDLLLRPLSAKLLPPTPMELDGRVDRERLLALEGRSRKPQMELAKKYGLIDYPSPAGGCKLTEPNYAKRLKELKAHEGLGDLRLIELLKHGRHIRLPEGGRAVIGRNKADNEAIRAVAATDDLTLRCAEVPGPSVLVLAGTSPADTALVLRMCAAYADSAGSETVLIKCYQNGKPVGSHHVAPLPRADFSNRLL